MKKAILLFVFSMAFSFSAWAQQTVTGVVTEAESGEPLAGVTVVVQGTTVGASTDIDGRYEISVPEDRNVLEFSFVGFEAVTEEIDGRTEINVVMGEDLQMLDDVVVTGYGTLSRRQVTSSIGQVSSEQLGDVSLGSADEALQGRVSGVQFSRNSGVLGDATTIRIRGASSISASTAPLVVIDGVPVTNPSDAGSASVGTGLGANTGVNPLMNLNPNDIESYEVLKDAAASAIYGSRGSNGVILITTKQGRADQARVNVRMSGGIVQETNRYDMMNGEEFTEIWNDAAENVGLLDFGFGLPTDDIQNTDWLEEVTQTGYMQETSASVSGGTENTRYYLSGNYRFEEGYIQNNELNRYSARLRIDHDLSDEVQVGLTLNPSRSDNFRVYTENAVAAPYTFGALHYPNVPVRGPEGELNLSIDPNPFTAFFGQPVGNLEGDDVQSNITQMLGTSYVNWNVTENFAFNSEFSFDLFQISERIRNADFTTNGSPTGSGFASNSQYRNFNWTNTAEYQNTFGDHDLNVLGGITLQENSNVSFSASGQNYANDQLMNLNSAADITGASGSGTSFSFVGYLSRINYTLQDRYIFSLTGRVDGSSRFSDENQYGFFPAFSAGWIVSDEDFYTSNTLDFLKLRASIGQTGNAEIGDFPTLFLAGYGNDYNNVPGGRITQLENPDLQWEKTTQLDGAVEFGVFDSRLRGTVGYYIKDTDDLLLNVPISRVNGFTSFTENIGAIRNQGLEFDLEADIFQGNFNWTTSLNISTIDNEVLRLDREGDQIFGSNMLRVGEPLGQFYVHEYAGVNPDNGNAQWIDEDGEVTDNFSEAPRKAMGSPFPDFFGGISNTFGYGGFDATIFFQYSYGNDLYRSDGTFTDTNLNSLFNQSTRQNDYWTPENTDAANPQPRLFQTNGAQANNSRYLEDASYLRLKQLTVGYTLPASITGNNNIRLYAQGQNILTVTSSEFNGQDPEASSGGNIQATDIFFQPPQPRQVMFGIDITL